MINNQDYWISGYKIMWMLVMFDLPVVEKSDRREAAKFRLYLQDEGFAMGQFSVYYKVLAGKEAVDAMIRRIEANLPSGGVVQAVMLTDKQYENIKTYTGKKKKNQEKNEQLVLF